MEDTRKAARMNGLTLENSFARRKSERLLYVECGSSQSWLPRGQAPWRANAKANIAIEKTMAMPVMHERLIFGRGMKIVIAVAAAMLAMICPAALVRAGQTVVVVLDDSGSMDKDIERGRKKMTAAKDSLAQVLRSLSRDTKVGILALNSRVGNSNWIVPVGSPDPSRWESELHQVRAKGGTPLGSMMRSGADELLKLRAQSPYDTYRLLVVTDGEATDARLLDSLLPDLMSRGLNVDVIGVAMKEAHTLANSAHTYRAAGDMAALTEALSAVFAETSGDSQSSQSDFQMLAGLSEEVAGEIVKSLTAPRNDPLQTMDERAADSTAIDQPTWPNGAPNPIHVPANQGGGPTVGGAVGILLSTMCCLGSMGLVMLIIGAVIVNAVKRNTRS